MTASCPRVVRPAREPLTCVFDCHTTLAFCRYTRLPSVCMLSESRTPQPSTLRSLVSLRLLAKTEFAAMEDEPVPACHTTAPPALSSTRLPPHVSTNRVTPRFAVFECHSNVPLDRRMARSPLQ